MATRYVVQVYERYAIYEPAEGGYYYEGLEPFEEPEEVCDTKREAADALRRIVELENVGKTREDEGYLQGGADGLWAGSRNHRYIGEGYEVYVEPLKTRGSHAKGREPYC